MLFSAVQRSIFELGQAAVSYARTSLPPRVGAIVDDATETTLPPKVMQSIVSLYSWAYQVDLNESERSSFETLDAFFTRKLRDNARPIDRSADAFVSPCDGTLVQFGPVDKSGVVTIKRWSYSLSELFLREIRSGSYGIIYLSPRDYHRVHMPCDARVSAITNVPGEFFPVNSLSEKVPYVLVRNRRVVVQMQSPIFGRVDLAMIAAFAVGRITISGIASRDVAGSIASVRSFEKGEELGVFHLGSTVAFAAERLSSEAHAPRSVRFGQPISRAQKEGIPS